MGRELAGDAADRNGDEMQYAWDANGDLAGVTYPDGNTATYAYNQFGEMTSMKDWLSHTASFAYDSDGNLTDSRRTERMDAGAQEQVLETRPPRIPTTTQWLPERG